MGTQEVLEDPRNYLHMEPWTQLVSISWQSVEEAVEIDNPFDDIRHNARTFGYMLWKPPSAVFKWLHNLRQRKRYSSIVLPKTGLSQVIRMMRKLSWFCLP
jgi:hypothetical protein